jgi:hypothetical protein
MTQDLLREEVAEPSSFASLGDLRQKILDGEEPSAEEYARVLAQLRRSRTAAPTSRSKAAKPLPNVNLAEDFG